MLRGRRNCRILVAMVCAQTLTILMLATDTEQRFFNRFSNEDDSQVFGPDMKLKQTMRHLSTDKGGESSETDVQTPAASRGESEIDQSFCLLPHMVAGASANLLHSLIGAPGSDTNARTSVMTLARSLVADLESKIGTPLQTSMGGSQAMVSMPDERLCLGVIDELMKFTKLEMSRAAMRRTIKPAATALAEIVDRMNKSRAVDDQPLERLDAYGEDEDGPLPTWKRFSNGVTRHGLYSDGDDTIDELEKEMRTLPIGAIDTRRSKYGTQMHMTLLLEGGGKVMFKPKRLARDYERPIDIQVYYDIERHTAEIAAYHLDRLLGHHRVPPTVGRKLHIVNDIQVNEPYNATGDFFYSVDGHLCFTGVCEATCMESNLICADDNKLLEGSLTAWFPSRWADGVVNPYTTVCGENCTDEEFQDRFVRDPDYCSAGVRSKAPFDNDRMFLHLVDAHIFDFLIGNRDRHDYDHFMDYWSDSFLVLYDNGKGFGRAKSDDMLLLAPLYQCCMVRLSTVERLLGFHNGPDHLSDLMRRSLATDDLDQILTEDHLAALDRRVAIVLEEIYKCTQNVSDRPVIVDDGL